MTDHAVDLDQLSINTIRLLSVDMVQQANSGHPGLPLGAAPMAYVLFSKFLNFNPQDPHWPNRDRFVLSAGHGSALLYSLLHLYGYDLPLEELKRFRQLHSKTPGHPESNLTAGVEVTTGPLGQGFANGVGMAMAEAHLAATYNKEGHTVMDHHTYAIVSDGDLMEGIASEAASLAGHLKLGKLIYLYDDNLISLDGPTNLAFTEDRMARFDAYGWHTQQVADGNDLGAIEAAIRAAQADDRPSIIAVRTIIGFGSPQEGTSKTHGSPLGDENLRKTKEFFGFDPNQSFVIPDDVRTHLLELGHRGKATQYEWLAQFDAYEKQFSAEAKLFKTSFAGAESLPDGWDANLPKFTPADGDMATRQASGKALLALKDSIPYLFGGSADLASSNEMPTKGDISFQPDRYQDTNIWFGVREHAMGAALNGMSQHGGVRPYGGTFLNFSDYMRGAIRLTALAESAATFVFTHDSIGLGEDGPTHQPVEQVIGLRTVPNIIVLRPADANETVEAWRVAMLQPKTPVVLILSRQKLPVLDQTKYGSVRSVEKGAYILSEAEGGTPELILIATGSEVQLVMKAQAELQKQGVKARVVSMPSWELFEKQDKAYQHEVLPPTIRKRLSVEMGSPIGWHKYVTDEGASLSMNRFGLSGPAEEVMAYFGFTVENVVKKAQAVLAGNAEEMEEKEVLS
ncbi:transketolase [Fibrella aquatilis]|uniref:Transketolase n=1 Tax=Fibrella aquatilis TaxID=2817059 RepID=A0A939G6H8_9BACT|nr:transketolase [Fibrella aquatilis]MBO0933064.1 transketolase [Fibrella aquatilis]